MNTQARRRLLLIGIGVGSVEHVTAQAARALGGVDVVFTVDKGDAKADLNALRAEICAAHARPGMRTVAVAEPERDRNPVDYPAEVRRWHDARAQVWAQALRTELAPGQVGAFLVWGDPALYDSTLRILDTVTGTMDTVDATDLELVVEVIPGITAVQVLTAAHRVPLNTIGGAVHVTTGRRLRDDAARAQPGDTLVVMLDAGSAHAELDGAEWDIWWGAHLGAADQVLLDGPLAQVGEQITAAKAAARERHGWVMDTYLLRRRSDPVQE